MQLSGLFFCFSGRLGCRVGSPKLAEVQVAECTVVAHGKPSGVTELDDLELAHDRVHNVWPTLLVFISF
jgi:hypothetical protein